MVSTTTSFIIPQILPAANSSAASALLNGQTMLFVDSPNMGLQPQHGHLLLTMQRQMVCQPQIVQQMVPQMLLQQPQIHQPLTVLTQLPAQHQAVAPQPLAAPRPVAATPTAQPDDAAQQTPEPAASVDVDGASSLDKTESNVGDDALARSRVLRASCKTHLRGLAGAIAKRARCGSPILLEGIGPSPVAKVMRALMQATLFLSDRKGLQLLTSCQQVRQYPGARSSFVFNVDTAASVGGDMPSGPQLAVHGANGKNNADAIALRIVKTVRSAEGLRKMCVSCGPSACAILCAIKAITQAREMLDEVDCDLGLVPLTMEMENVGCLLFELVPSALAGRGRAARMGRPLVVGDVDA